MKQEIYFTIPYFKSACLTGSKTLPWILEPHDSDIIIYVDSLKDVKMQTILQHREHGDCIRFCDLKTINLVRIYSYQYHYLQPLLGTEYPHYDIFEHEIEQKKEILRYVSTGRIEKRPKLWYHILTTMYMFENGKYELTDEQAKNVNACHDYQMTEEVYSYIQQKLQEYKNELNI